MTPIKPEALHGQAFSKIEFGYDPAEVDDHIRRLTENYSLLYRENASLLKQLRETGAKLRTLETALARADHVLKDAQEQKDKIIADTQAICAEMEGASIAHTAYRNGIPFVCSHFSCHSYSPCASFFVNSLKKSCMYSSGGISL